MKRLPWYSAVLYLFGVLFGAFALWTAIDTMREIFEYLGSGIPAYDFAAFFARQAGVWIIYTLVLLSLGRILQLMAGREDDDELYFDDDASANEQENQGDSTQTTPDADSAP